MAKKDPAGLPTDPAERQRELDYREDNRSWRRYVSDRYGSKPPDYLRTDIDRKPRNRDINLPNESGTRDPRLPPLSKARSLRGGKR